MVSGALVPTKVAARATPALSAKSNALATKNTLARFIHFLLCS
jgi:hypothetical protein